MVGVGVVWGSVEEVVNISFDGLLRRWFGVVRVIERFIFTEVAIYLGTL